ncbi:MAG: response regulator transcription factor [Acidobacteriota bacterium]
MSFQQKPLVLIIDDDAAFAGSMAETFERDGIRASTAFFAEEGYDKTVRQRPDMIILDINLQREGEGFELLPRLQQATEASIVVLTARGTVREDLEAAGRGGATHYFNKAEALPDTLSVFVRSQLAKLGKWTHTPLRLGHTVLDVQARKLLIQGVPVPLTEMQAEILAVLMEPPAGHWKTHAETAGKVYGDTGYNEKAGVRKHIARIRSRLNSLEMGLHIETAHAHGYRLVVEGVNDQLEETAE